MDIKELEKQYGIELQKYLDYIDKLSAYGEIVEVLYDDVNMIRILTDVDGNKFTLELDEIAKAETGRINAIRINNQIADYYTKQYKDISIERGWEYENNTR